MTIQDACKEINEILQNYSKYQFFSVGVYKVEHVEAIIIYTDNINNPVLKDLQEHGYEGFKVIIKKIDRPFVEI